jgi:hypothetical protein
MLMARVSSPAVAETADRSSVRIELYGWAATIAFVALSYALRRLLNRKGRSP